MKNGDISKRHRLTVYIFERDKKFLKELREKFGGVSYSFVIRYIINKYKEVAKHEKV